MDARFKTLFNVILILATLVWLAVQFGVFDGTSHIGRVRV